MHSTIPSALNDIEQRRPVWNALADLFLDTDTSLSRAWRAEQLAASPYTLDELQGILIYEVYPVCWTNMLSVAGEWSGFDPEQLEERILAGSKSRFAFLRRFTLGRLSVLFSSEWRATKIQILRLRSQPIA